MAPQEVASAGAHQVMMAMIVRILCYAQLVPMAVCVFMALLLVVAPFVLAIAMQDIKVTSVTTSRNAQEVLEEKRVFMVKLQVMVLLVGAIAHQGSVVKSAKRQTGELRIGGLLLTVKGGAKLQDS